MEKQIEVTRSMNGIDQSFPYYVTRVYYPNGDLHQEHVFQEPDNDLKRARAKAFTRMEFEVEKDLPRDIEVFICQDFAGDIEEHLLKSLSRGSDREGLHQESLIHSNYGVTDWTEIEEMYDEEIKNLEKVENMKLQALTAIDKMDQAYRRLLNASLFLMMITGCMTGTPSYRPELNCSSQNWKKN